MRKHNIKVNKTIENGAVTLLFATYADNPDNTDYPNNPVNLVNPGNQDSPDGSGQTKST